MNPDTLCMSCMEDDSGSPICPQCGSPAEIPYTNTLQLRPRTVLRQQYLIGRALGQGGFGITYLAYDLGLQSRLAIKEYMPSGVAGRSQGTTTVSPFSEKTKEEYEWGLDRFLDEARVLKKFSSSPNIVMVDTIFRDNGTAYMVMEFLDGMTFEEFLRRRGGKVTLETAMRVMLPVMDALSVLHAEGILHRDISPDNIHLSKTGKVKLIDFGAARNALSQKSRNLSVILKEGYAPEEQYRSAGIQGPWTDVYSTAATLYHGITGIVPPPALDRHQGEDKLELPSRLGVTIPSSAERALMRALAVRATDRFQSMEDFKAALTGQAESAGAPRVVVATAPPPPIPQQSFAPPMPPVPQSAPPPSPYAAPPQAMPQQNFVPPMPPAPSYNPPPQQNYAPPPPMPPGPPRGPVAQGPPTGAPPMRQKSKGFPRWLIPVALLLLVALAGAATIAIHYGPELFHKIAGTSGQPGAASGDTGGPPPQSDEERQRQLEQQAQGQQPGQPADQQPAQGQDQPAAQPADQPADATPPAVAVTPVPVVAVPAAPVVAVPVAPPAVVVSPGYDAMLASAETFISNSQYDDAAALLKKAIASNPARPQAYNSLAKVQMYFLHAPTEAFQNYRAALAHGGSVSFYVYHDHASGEFQNYCSGWLTVSRGKASFKADDGIHSFPTEPVKEAKKNRLMGKFLSAQGKSIHAFHVRLMNNHNFNFGPSSETPGPESEFIVKVLETGS